VKRIPAIVLVILILGSIVAVLMPFYLVSPARSQTLADLELSRNLKHWNGTLTVINLLVGAILGWTIWRRPDLRRSGKGLVITSVLILALTAYGARVNFAHVMFTQLPEVVRVPVSEATHVQQADLLLAVNIEGEAAAYPFPIVGFHHLVHDRLAGEPYVVTF
jgi:hypothetical protein